MSSFKFIAAAMLLILCSSASIAALPLKAFQSNSLNEIINERQGQSFLLVLWSIDCPPCLKELAQFQKMRHRFSKSDLVLVATDNVQHTDTVQQLLNRHQLNKMDNWIFTDSMPERLRHQIDPNWYGELPRAYFYDIRHQRIAHSGSLDEKSLNQWLQKTSVKSSLKSAVE